MANVNNITIVRWDHLLPMCTAAESIILQDWETSSRTMLTSLDVASPCWARLKVLWALAVILFITSTPPDTDECKCSAWWHDDIIDDRRVPFDCMVLWSGTSSEIIRWRSFNCTSLSAISNLSSCSCINSLKLIYFSDKVCKKCKINPWVNIVK